MCERQEGFVLWLTGLPCSGKTTIADAVAHVLKARDIRNERLDGDIVRQGLTRDLRFSKEDRDKNIERVTFVAQLLSRNEVATIVSFVSPYREKRDYARGNTTNFIEVYVRCPVEVCMQRDVRGMYKKAMRGEIKDFTGVNDPYEEPQRPEIIVDTDKNTVDECVKKIINYLEDKGLIPAKRGISSGEKQQVKAHLKSLGYM